MPQENLMLDLEIVLEEALTSMVPIEPFLNVENFFELITEENIQQHEEYVVPLLAIKPNNPLIEDVFMGISSAEMVDEVINFEKELPDELYARSLNDEIESTILRSDLTFISPDAEEASMFVYHVDQIVDSKLIDTEFNQIVRELTAIEPVSTPQIPPPNEIELSASAIRQTAQLSQRNIEICTIVAVGQRISPAGHLIESPTKLAWIKVPSQWSIAGPPHCIETADIKQTMHELKEADEETGRRILSEHQPMFNPEEKVQFKECGAQRIDLHIHGRSLKIKN